MDFTCSKRTWVLLFVIAGLLIGCSPKSTPPGASTVGGVVEGAVFSYHYWAEGLAVLIWHDFSPGGGSCSGTGSTEDPVFRLECTVEAMDGQQLSWRVHTSDGVTGDMWIGDQPYDISQGAMFLVSAGEGGLQIEQHQRDLSTLEPITSAITALIDSDPEVAAFVAGKSRGSEETEAGEAFGLEELSTALHLADHVVTVAGEVAQPFFSVPGRIVKVDGEDVQVFVYPDVAAAGTEAALIAPDASSVGTSMVTWMATPHFFQRDHLIVLYVGDNDAVTGALANVLGKPVAEGQGMALPTPADSLSEPPPAEVSFVTTLTRTLVNQDYAVLEVLMGDPFLVGYWQSEGLILTPAEAIEQLQLNLLPNSTGVTFTTDPDLFPALGEFDPAKAFGPDVTITDLVYSEGWGTDGQNAAILTIAQNSAGTPYWHGIIIGPLGFEGIPDLAEFENQLVASVSTRNLPRMQTLMKPFYSLSNGRMVVMPGTESFWRVAPRVGLPG